jgi:serine/threonine protein kinase
MSGRGPAGFTPSMASAALAQRSAEESRLERRLVQLRRDADFLASVRQVHDGAAARHHATASAVHRDLPPEERRYRQIWSAASEAQSAAWRLARARQGTPGGGSGGGASSSPPPPSPASPAPAGRRPRRPSSAQQPRAADSGGVKSDHSEARPTGAVGAAAAAAAAEGQGQQEVEAAARMRGLVTPGALRDHYTLGRVLGQGSTSTVREARCRKSQIQVAVKIIAKRSNHHFSFQALLTECTLMQRLRGHPGMLQLIAVFESPTSYSLVLEHMGGGDLFGILIARINALDSNTAEGDCGPYSEVEAAATIRHITQAVAICHANGICHRDLKPENILVCTSESGLGVVSDRAHGWQQRDDRCLVVPLKLADFGLAADISGDRKLYDSCGTVEFVAPEVISPVVAHLGYGAPVDVWSLGVLLYILLCGYAPFNSMKEIVSAPLQFPHEEWRTVSCEAIALLQRMLHRSPASRPTAAQVLEDPWIAGRSASSRLAPAVLPKLRRWNARRKFKGALLALIAGRRMEQLVCGLELEKKLVPSPRHNYHDQKSGLTEIGVNLHVLRYRY